VYLSLVAVSDVGRDPYDAAIDGRRSLVSARHQFDGSGLEEARVANQHVLGFSPTVRQMRGTPWPDGIVGDSPAIRAVLERARRAAPTDVPVLITGETGTGKELLARSIHRLGRRVARPLVAVNLAAIPETLAAAELFGCERGAFTGADRQRIGRFELADRGTLFLDEVGELRPDIQVMLLRVLQEGEVERLGGGPSRRIDVRLVAATNRDLEAEVQAGRFREDLFYRLNVFPIQLPPLRSRREDIPALAAHFLDSAAEVVGRRFTGIEPRSLRRLQEYDWPGNIRQLQNVIEQSAIVCDDRQLSVPEEALASRRVPIAGAHSDALFAERPTLEEVKKRYIRHLLATTRGNMLRTAAILDVDRRSLYRMVARYQLGTPAAHRNGEPFASESAQPMATGLAD
jgi:DNA-binding NtrC family response regulator